MEIKADIKHVRISPKKLRFIVDDVKKMKPVDALNALLYSPKRGAKILLKAIKSAISNAKNNYKIDENLLRFKLLSVESGRSLKRFRPGGRGTTKPFKRRTSHIKVVLISESVTNLNSTALNKLGSVKEDKSKLKIVKDKK